jgi:hypothetical protein
VCIAFIVEIERESWRDFGRCDSKIFQIVTMSRFEPSRETFSSQPHLCTHMPYRLIASKVVYDLNAIEVEIELRWEKKRSRNKFNFFSDHRLLRRSGSLSYAHFHNISSLEVGSTSDRNFYDSSSLCEMISRKEMKRERDTHSEGGEVVLQVTDIPPFIHSVHC